MARLLIVDGESECRSALRRLFERLGHSVDEASDAKEATSSACSGDYDLGILDLDLPRRSGIRALTLIKEECPDLPVVVTAGAESVDAAVRALKLGAYHYVTKPPNLDEMRIVVERTLEHSRLVSQNGLLLQELRRRYGFDSLIGSDPRAKEAYALAAQAAQTDSAVLIVGETGTGKDFLARAIHYQSKRAGGPFVKINCAGMPESQLDAELFGGGADGLACFELARDGSVFLDEVAGIGPEIQAKLLRALQRKPPVRIIAGASAHPMDRDFRDDLYRYLAGFVIPLPALRDRRDDIPAFADHFVRKYSFETGKAVRSIASDAMAQLISCDWRGNIRELENCIERSVILCDSDCIRSSHLALNGAAPAKRKQGPVRSLREVERDHIRKVLIYCNWNRSNAASILEIDRKTLRSKIREFGFTPPSGK